jgi:hypothetical protein
MLFFVKVRIDVERLDELDRRLQDGTLDRTALRATYCYRDDPEVGLNIWEAQDAADLRRRFAPHRAYYRDVVEITPVVSPVQALAELRA